MNNAIKELAKTTCGCCLCTGTHSDFDCHACFCGVTARPPYDCNAEKIEQAIIKQMGEVETIIVSLLEMIELGELVRNTARDGEPDFTPRMMKLAMTLKKASEIRDRRKI